jgi:hypothetical protein
MPKLATRNQKLETRGKDLFPISYFLVPNSVNKLVKSGARFGITARFVHNVVFTSLPAVVNLVVYAQFFRSLYADFCAAVGNNFYPLRGDLSTQSTQLITITTKYKKLIMELL